MKCVFKETPVFTKQVTSLITDDELKEFQAYLLEQPERGAMIEGTGGCRKIRWGRDNSGKSGGMRIIYYWMNDKRVVYLLLAYPKGVQDTLTSDQKKVLKGLVKSELGE